MINSALLATFAQLKALGKLKGGYLVIPGQGSTYQAGTVSIVGVMWPAGPVDAYGRPRRPLDVLLTQYKQYTISQSQGAITAQDRQAQFLVPVGAVLPTPLPEGTKLRLLDGATFDVVSLNEEAGVVSAQLRPMPGSGTFGGTDSAAVLEEVNRAILAEETLAERLDALELSGGGASEEVIAQIQAAVTAEALARADADTATMTTIAGLVAAIGALEARVGLHGNGAPGAGLGMAGSTYVDDLSSELWWKTTQGWIR